MSAVTRLLLRRERHPLFFLRLYFRLRNRRNFQTRKLLYLGFLLFDLIQLRELILMNSGSRGSTFLRLV